MTGPLTTYRTLNATTTGEVAATRPAALHGFTAYNNASAVRFLKIYDLATAPTHANTPDLTVGIPPNGAVTFCVPNGIVFCRGISLRASQLIADADTTAPSANDVSANLVIA
jgi:hypothetical protein